MNPVAGGTAPGDAYLALRRQARRTGRPTQELLQLYVLEGFLARLAYSELCDRFVLEGGVLLAAFGSQRPTRDVDLAGLDLSNDREEVLGLVRRILEVRSQSDDGIEFDGSSMAADTIREEDDYSGVRVRVVAHLASAKVSFHVDVNVGDPIWPSPVKVAIPRLRGGEPIELQGYPIHMVHAEKIVTAIQRGIANTRWRDFSDIWSLSRGHSIASDDLTRAIEQVALHRKAAIAPLAEVLDGFADLGQERWGQWRRRGSSNHLPERFGSVLDAVSALADPVLTGAADDLTRDHERGSWVRQAGVQSPEA